MRVLRMIEEQWHRDAEDDRPLREGRTPPEALRPGDLEYRACPYPGARRGRPMNVGALRQTRARWDEIAAALGVIRAAYAESRGSYAGDVLDVWRVSQLGSALPWIYVLRAPGAAAPAFAAALAKATLGTGLLAQRLLLEELIGGRAPAGAGALLAAAERTGALLTEREVCAAPAAMILRFLAPLTAGAAAPPRGAGAGVAAPARSTQVAALAAVPGAIASFGAHYLAFKYLAWLAYLARRFAYADLAAALGAHPHASAARALRDAPCEPPDFFEVGPPDLAATPLLARGAWLRRLAAPLEPIAPATGPGAIRSDAAQCARGPALAAAVEAVREPAGAAAAAREVAARLTLGAEPAAIAGRALAQWLAIDDLSGAALAAAEVGLTDALAAAAPALAAGDAGAARAGGPGAHRAPTAAERDRAVAAPGRALVQLLAPAWLVAAQRP